MPESNSHGENTRTDTSIVRYLITDNGTADSSHDEPDISFYATDLDIGFVSGKRAIDFVVIIVNKRLNADSGSFAVVGDLLVGNADVIKVFMAREVFLKDNPRLMWRVRHRDITCALCLENFSDDAFFEKEFKSMAKKSTVNSR